MSQFSLHRLTKLWQHRKIKTIIWWVYL